MADTPGACNAHYTKEYVHREIAKAVATVTPGPHAILMVVRCSVRFTQEMGCMYKELKELFGEEITKFMIVVFTGTDDLSGESLAYVLKNVPPKLQQIMADAQGRCISFDNTLPWGERQKQGDALLRLVGHMMTQNGGRYYSTDLVKRVEEIMQQKWHRAKLPKRSRKC